MMFFKTFVNKISISDVCLIAYTKKELLCSVSLIFC
jgi:hypothetical protein